MPPTNSEARINARFLEASLGTQSGVANGAGGGGISMWVVASMNSTVTMLDRLKTILAGVISRSPGGLASWLQHFARRQIIFIEYNFGLGIWRACHPVLFDRDRDDGSGADISYFPSFAVTPERVSNFHICSFHIHFPNAMPAAKMAAPVIMTVATNIHMGHSTHSTR
jgi:hypothetical protein